MPKFILVFMLFTGGYETEPHQVSVKEYASWSDCSAHAELVLRLNKRAAENQPWKKIRAIAVCRRAEDVHLQRLEG